VQVIKALKSQADVEMKVKKSKAVSTLPRRFSIANCLPKLRIARLNFCDFERRTRALVSTLSHTRAASTSLSFYELKSVYAQAGSHYRDAHTYIHARARAHRPVARRTPCTWMRAQVRTARMQESGPAFFTNSRYRSARSCRNARDLF